MKIARKSLVMAAIALAGLFVSTNASAQDDKKPERKPYPHMFVGLQGGGQTTLTDYAASKLITPIAGVSFGVHLTPVVGVRLSSQGWKNKGGIKSINQKYDFKYVQTNVDLMLNLVNFFSEREYSKFNVYAILGAGLAYGWNYEVPGSVIDDDMPLNWRNNKLSHNVRLAAQLSLECGRHFGINIEGGVNNMFDRINAHRSGDCDWQPYLMAGVAFKFGHRKVAEPEPVIEPEPEPEPVWETVVDTIWYDDELVKMVDVEESLERNVHFPIRGYDAQSPARKELEEVAAFVKSHRDCKVDVKAYADKGTGSPRINKKYSEQRREGTVKALVELGVSAEAITSESLGDTVQPFANNDDNRVSIVTVKGIGQKKEVEKVRKFRTEERQVRVQ